MDALGIANSDRIIVYGTDGCMFTTRSWYTIRSMGHTKVHLLQGSIKDWQELGGDIETGYKASITTNDIIEQQQHKEPKYSAIDAVNTVTMNQVLDIIQRCRTICRYRTRTTTGITRRSYA